MGEGGITTGFRWGGGVAQLSPFPHPQCQERELLVPLPQPLQGSAETQAVADSWNQAASPGETAPSWGDQSLCSESWRSGACRSYNSSISGGARRQRMFPGQGEVPSRMGF